MSTKSEPGNEPSHGYCRELCLDNRNGIISEERKREKAQQEEEKEAGVPTNDLHDGVHKVFPSGHARSDSLRQHNLW